MFGVGEVCWELIAGDVGEWSFDGGKPARGDLVGTDCTAHRVVVKSCVAVNGGVAGPGETTG